MRIDLLLNYLCLAKSRSIAKSLCNDGAVRIGDRIARPSSHVREGEVLSLETRAGTRVLEVLRIPDRQLSKSLAPEYYREIRYTRRREAEFDDWEEGR